MAPSFTSGTNKPGVLNVLRRITVVLGGTAGNGAVSVPHGLSYTPNLAILANTQNAAGPVLGPTVNLDGQNAGGQGLGIMLDGTNVYIYASGPGTFDLLVG